VAPQKSGRSKSLEQEKDSFALIFCSILTLKLKLRNFGVLVKNKMPFSLYQHKNQFFRAEQESRARERLLRPSEEVWSVSFEQDSSQQNVFSQ